VKVSFAREKGEMRERKVINVCDENERILKFLCFRCYFKYFKFCEKNSYLNALKFKNDLNIFPTQ